ncbi:MAG: OmpA family protein [Deltaproteobacteria bacterium]|nr:OmpA family protein [Deltaproteobacteria bacterium]
MTRILLICLLGLGLIAAPGPVGADCGRAEVLYNQALAAPDLNRKAELLKSSLEECRTFSAYYALGGVLLEQGRFEEARQALKDGLNLAGGPKAEAMALARLGQVYEAQGELQEAVVCLRQSYKSHPFPKVLDKQRQIETLIVKQGVSAESIKRGLTSRAARTFGVEPTVDLRIHFDYDSAELNAQGRMMVRELGLALTDNVFLGRSFVLIGHTDQRGSEAYNQGLSQRRAETVKRYLILNFGQLAGRLWTEGRGERELLYPGRSEQAHALNRRVEVRLR